MCNSIKTKTILAGFWDKNTGFPSCYFKQPEKDHFIAHLDYSIVKSKDFTKDRNLEMVHNLDS